MAMASFDIQKIAKNAQCMMSHPKIHFTFDTNDGSNSRASLAGNNDDDSMLLIAHGHIAFNVNKLLDSQTYLT